METRQSNPPGSKSRRGKVLAFATLALFAAIAVGVTLFTHPAALAENKPASPPPRPATTVEVAEVIVAPGRREIASVGTLRANESIVLRPEIGGRIARIHFAEGTQVKEGEPLFTLDRTVLQAQFDQIEASRALHLANYKRAEALLFDRAISERERDEAYAQWQLDEASVRLARAQLAKTVLKAPFTGTTGLRQVSVGDVVAPGQDLVNLEDISRLKVELDLPGIQSARIAVGQKLNLTTDAFPDMDFAAELYAIDPRFNEKGGSIAARALLDNRDGLLHPGQFVNSRLVVEEHEAALFIPEQAVMPQPGKMFVMKVVEAKAVLTPIEIGPRRDGMVEILTGLSAGDFVVTGGLQKIGDGSPVNAVKADPQMFAKIP